MKTSKKLLALYKLGKYKHQQIADKVGVSYSHAQSFYFHNREKHSLPKVIKERYSGLVENIQYAHTEYLEGATLAQIADKYDVSRQYVHATFIKYGLSTRPVTGKIRKFFYCDRGHKLDIEKHEYRAKCGVCRKERKEFRLKTHCKHGHEYTKENTIINEYEPGKYNRKCRTCHYAVLKRGRQ
jgi:hypothetical protein